MLVRDTIIQKIKEKVLVAAPVTELSELYTDLNLDSLSFITLLAEIEDEYSVNFDIMEMESCLQVGQLIKLTENKIKERDKLK